MSMMFRSLRCSGCEVSPQRMNEENERLLDEAIAKCDRVLVILRMLEEAARKKP